MEFEVIYLENELKNIEKNLRDDLSDNKMNQSTHNWRSSQGYNNPFTMS
jgi:hypothetical protein